MGENSKLGMSLCTSCKRIILICVCGWHQIGWKETNYRSDVESTQWTSWLGGTNIISWPCLPRMYPTTVWNKQRCCWQLQNHVRIQEFRRSNGKNYQARKHRRFLRGPTIRKFMPKSVKWRTKQRNSCTKSLLLVLVTINPKKKKNWNAWENCQMYALKLPKNVCIWRSAIKFARAITKWTRACGKRPARLISHIHFTSEYKPCCHVGNTPQLCRLGLFQDFDFAGDPEDTKWTSGGTLPHIFSGKLDVQETDMCVTQFKGIWNYFSWCRFAHGRNSRAWSLGFGVDVLHSNSSKTKIQQGRGDPSYCKASEKSEVTLEHADFSETSWCRMLM